ncbi:MAG: integrase family protein [Firmicutes bacterium]|nr:integrase family protein [Bacillota bacterium]
MPSKIKKRGVNSYLLSVKYQQKEYTKTVYTESKNEADRLWKLFASEVIQGNALSGDTQKMTLLQFYDYWKRHYAVKNNELTTIAYDDSLFIRAGATLGHLKIDKILPRHILEFLDQLSAPDAGHGNKPLSPNTIRKHYNLLTTLFNAAKQWKFVINNPLDDIKPPKQTKPNKKIASEEAMTLFLEKLSHETLKHQLWVLLAFGKGLRREEIFGLQWGDFDFEKNTVTISRAAVYITGIGITIKDTKSDNSYRTLSLPTDIVTMIKMWKEEVKIAAQRRNKRLKIIIMDDPVSVEKWIFSQVNGNPGHPHSFNTFLKRFYNANNDLPKLSPHLLRHMTGSYLIRSGVDVASVSAELGHSNKAFTMNTYIHELESAKEHAATTMQGILNNLKPKTSF